MNPNEKYFKHSGSVPVTALILMPVCGLIAALALAFVYAYAIAYIPFIYLNFFITLFFGVGIGMVIGFIGQMTTARSPMVAGGMGLGVGMIAYYLACAIWIRAIGVFEDLDSFIWSPMELRSSLDILVEHGAWQIFGWTPTGAWLYGVWGIELLMIVGASSYMAWSWIKGSPFCETCRVWLSNESILSPFEPIEQKDNFRNLLDGGDFSPLWKLKKTNDLGQSHTQFELQHCESCTGLNLLTVSSVTVTVKKKDEVDVDTDIIVEQLLVNKENFQKLQTLEDTADSVEEEESSEAPENTTEEE